MVSVKSGDISQAGGVGVGFGVSNPIGVATGSSWTTIVISFSEGAYTWPFSNDCPRKLTLKT
jgi:hypothetical protein